MKTTKISLLAIAATCAMGASAFADQQCARNHQCHRRTAVSSRTMEKQPQAKQSRLVSAVESPFMFMGRAGRSVWHTPEIVSETFKGQRSLISKQGIMARNQQAKAGERMASAPAQSTGNRRS